MSEKKGFSHLPLPLVLSGRPKLRGGGTPDERTKQNKENRTNHGNYIKGQAAKLSKFWKERQEERLKEHLPEIRTGIPILLEIDPSNDISFLKGLGFEVISELENGYVIVSNGDTEFATLNRKTEDFINEVSSKCNTPARIYAFHEEETRLQKIFGKKLLSIWNAIEENKNYEVDISISCSGNIFDLEQPPIKEDGISDSEYQESKEYKNWQKKYYEAYEKWDDLKFEREQQFESFIADYKGEFTGAFVDGDHTYLELCDSFSVRVKINGKCLRDLVYNFSPIYEIEYVGELCIGKSVEAEMENISTDITIVAPDEDAPIIAVIDSGIQENHKYIEPAIISEDSKCYVKGTTSVSDEVKQGGHGTRVTSAILYPYEIPRSGVYKLPCFIRNARVLNEDNEHCIQTSIFPPLVIRAVVNEYTKQALKKTKIFNHSIAEISS